MRALRVIVIGIVITGSLLASETVPAEPSADQPMIGEKAPEFVLPSISGDSLSLASLRGKYVIMHFGTSW